MSSAKMAKNDVVNCCNILNVVCVRDKKQRTKYGPLRHSTQNINRNYPVVQDGLFWVRVGLSELYRTPSKNQDIRYPMVVSNLHLFSSRTYSTRGLTVQIYRGRIRVVRVEWANVSLEMHLWIPSPWPQEMLTDRPVTRSIKLIPFFENRTNNCRFPVYGNSSRLERFFHQNWEWNREHWPK